MPIINHSVEQFIMLLASKEPAPGGGSASALLGAIGSALSSMVINLTMGKEKFKDQEEFLLEILKESENLQKEFLNLIEEDTTAFNKVSRAYKMPKDTEEQKEARREALEKALKDATLVPLSIMEKGLSFLKLLEKCVGKTNPNVVSDIGVSALCMKSAIQGGWLNVIINLKYIKDEDFTREIKEKAKNLLLEGIKIADQIYNQVEQFLIK
ncbi:MAG: cyclodeaminase/cyclohydrolase family protein [Dictyoglomus sp.]|nr:cyclodeaminase/cyclohydrolase family protein [Dictyoglomus sp.]MCX7942157.1 cyclodeaminase/cyclohydrolase family protein [Dictyoglomaceae bacterium]MDW8188516.1 cyclodeaminase/cyclohydrolase family protein [Dictyoglomus sp.]